MYKNKIAVLLIILLLGGCAQADKIGLKVEELGTSLKYHVQGSHYIASRDYSKGEKLFRSAIKEDPFSQHTNYYLGRFLLAQGKDKEALPYLKKAVDLNPKDSDYNFWLGIAYGENGKRKLEKQSYLNALANDPEHLQSLIYLGHSHLMNKEYTTALTTYDKVLKIWPLCPPALYNRALIMKILGRTPEERLAWLEYLDVYPSGALARRAADHLNLLSDFSYRNHTLGARTVTITKIHFKPFKADLDSGSYPSLKLIGAAASNMGKGTLQIVVYQKNNRKLARQRAISIKQYLLDKFPALNGDRVGISWFDEPEKFSISGRQITADESVRFFLSDIADTHR